MLAFVLAEHVICLELSKLVIHTDEQDVQPGLQDIGHDWPPSHSTGMFCNRLVHALRAPPARFRLHFRKAHYKIVKCNFIAAVGDRAFEPTTLISETLNVDVGVEVVYHQS